MQGTYLLTEIKRIIEECEDFKGKGESRYHEELKELSAYNRIKELIGDDKDTGNGNMQDL